MERDQMNKDISELKINQAVLVQKQEQTDKVIEKIGDSLSSLESKCTKGFYIALGVLLVASGSLGDVGKLAVKLIGG